MGTYSNDFAGADTELSLGYAYNSSNDDDSFEAFNLAPAAVGWDFLQGPVDAAGDTLGLTRFVYFAAGSAITDPTLGDYTGTIFAGATSVITDGFTNANRIIGSSAADPDTFTGRTDTATYTLTSTESVYEDTSGRTFGFKVQTTPTFSITNASAPSLAS